MHILTPGALASGTLAAVKPSKLWMHRFSPEFGCSHGTQKISEETMTFELNILKYVKSSSKHIT